MATVSLNMESVLSMFNQLNSQLQGGYPYIYDQIQMQLKHDLECMRFLLFTLSSPGWNIIKPVEALFKAMATM